MEKKLTIKDIIDHYLAHYCDPMPNGTNGFVTMWSEMNEIKSYYKECVSNQPGCYSFEKVIWMCVRGLYTTGHQKRVDGQAINDAVTNLMTGKFADFRNGKNCSLVNKTTRTFYKHFIDFEELYYAVLQLIGNVQGIGYVTLYDTARRIGYLLDQPIYPVAYVYLHYNCVNKAAQSILRKKLAFREPATSFLCEFCAFPSICIEDILCIFSDVFIKVFNFKDDSDETITKSVNNNWRNMPLKDFLEKEDERLKPRQSPQRWPEFSKH